MKIKLSIWKVTLAISLFISVFDNFSFWKGIQKTSSFTSSPLLFISFFIIILMLINLLLTLVSFKPIFKIVASILLLVSAFAAYFMDNYSVMIDKGMIQNVLLTNVNEASDFLSIRLFITVLFLGILPIIFIYKANIQHKPFFTGLLKKVLIMGGCIGVIASTLYINYQELSFFGREHRELRHLINPTNYLFSLKSVISKKVRAGKIIVKPIEHDARKRFTPKKQGKPSLVILVLGETARAMNFSLNGYKRNTNPLLAEKNIINFSNVTSCGTATAVSVPCMFSKFPRNSYSDSKGLQFENLLDVINHADYDVLWRDNNTGCQGLCKRIAFENLAHMDNDKYCKNGNCVDEILLHDLQEIVDENVARGTSRDKVIILHQKGNHGPTYYKRYPNEFEVFKPACKTNQLQSCSEEEVINAYDNAILYTDYFLAKSIDFLKANTDRYNTALVYISDHGESLGEKNLYLHGLPYVIAPMEQKKVPFMLWLSGRYKQAHSINESCVLKKSNEKLSHDNFFSSMLGLLGIQTEVYDSNLDVFSSCYKTK